MIITISGLSGSGKSTIAEMLSSLLGWERFYMGGERRKIALDMGITLAELNKRDEKEFFSDRIVDERIVELGRTRDNIIIESRTAWHFVPKSLKLFFSIGIDEAARRVFDSIVKEGKRPEEKAKTLEEVKNGLLDVNSSDSKRFRKYYGVDCYNPANFDIVVDTSNKSVPDVLKETIERLKEHGVKFHKGPDV